VEYRCSGLLAVFVTVLVVMLAPATASAWQVTVNIHGAGGIDETTAANLLNCETGVTGRSNASTFTCTGGTPTGNYQSGWIVELSAYVPAAYADRGWRFSAWEDTTVGGRVNCDDQPADKAYICKFQIWENLTADLYFLDTQGPQDTVITAASPSGTTSSASASFGFKADSDPDATFECRLQGPGQAGAYEACGSSTYKSESYSGLNTGAYAFTVRALDPSGNVDATPDSRSWTVDRTPPTTAIVGGPPAGGYTNAAEPAFSFTAGEGGATFQCALDGGAYAPCSSPHRLTGLADKSYVFAVRATDPYGNMGAPATRTFTVDRQVPDTTLLDGPAEGSSSPDGVATFTFASPESGVAFECRLDGAAFAPCASPKRLEGIPNGDHTFEVRAVDQAGNQDATPATRSWRVNSLDADSDGINRPADCDDGNPAIHPGLTDVPDNLVDEDSDGADRTTAATTGGGAGGGGGGGGSAGDGGSGAAAVPVSVSLNFYWLFKGSKTWARTLLLRAMTAGTTVTLTCKGGGCPFKTRTARPSSKGAVDAKRLLKKRKLSAGAVLTIRVAAPGAVTKVITFKMRRNKPPIGSRFSCLPPGAPKPLTCAAGEPGEPSRRLLGAARMPRRLVP
jgi:hypothetical protein